jgi:outer membrane lipoprotein-sorting protein
MKKLLAFAAMLFAGTFAFSQITTAAQFFSSVSDYYATLTDYETNLNITIGRKKLSGKVSFKRPEMLRIDFTSPADQVIVFDGDNYKCYLPESSAILEQAVSGNSANLSKGLSLMSRYYTIAYESGQDPVALEEGSEEMVVNLILSRRTASEEFRTIKLSVNPTTKLIRRVTATSTKNEVYVFDFTEYSTNIGISEKRFVYDPPTSANNYSNFLFSE